MAIEGSVGICTECKTRQKDSYLIKKGFGWAAPCQFCGGVIAAVPEQNADDPRIKVQMDRQRNIDSDPDRS